MSSFLSGIQLTSTPLAPFYLLVHGQHGVSQKNSAKGPICPNPQKPARLGDRDFAIDVEYKQFLHIGGSSKLVHPLLDVYFAAGAAMMCSRYILPG